MYAYLNGTLIEATPHEAIIDVQGIGYQVSITIKDFSRLPQLKERVFIYTSLVVRETSQTLYGFLTKEERTLFEELITITGIGPKTGLGIIGRLSCEELREAVKNHDSACLAKVPGIGKKTAERLLIELQGRLKIQAISAQPQGRLSDALQALTQLGYTQAAAEKAVKRATETLDSECDLSTIISQALKYRH